MVLLALRLLNNFVVMDVIKQDLVSEMMKTEPVDALLTNIDRKF